MNSCINHVTLRLRVEDVIFNETHLARVPSVSVLCSFPQEPLYKGVPKPGLGQMKLRAYGSVAVELRDDLKAGDSVIVDGQVCSRTYTDKNNGTQREVYIEPAKWTVLDNSRS